MMTRIGFYLSGVIAAGIIFIGCRFLLAPSTAAAAYGVPAGAEPHLRAYLSAKGIRLRHTDREGRGCSCPRERQAAGRRACASEFNREYREGGAQREWEQATPLRNVGSSILADPARIAPAAVFLASDEARHITGAALLVDGGMNSI